MREGLLEGVAIENGHMFDYTEGILNAQLPSRFGVNMDEWRYRACCWCPDSLLPCSAIRGLQVVRSGMVV